VIECFYCGRDIAEEVKIPSSRDDEAWRKVAEGHETDCEWVLTRAHRLNTEGGGK